MQWAIIGKDPNDAGSKRRYSDFQAAMAGGSVTMETMGPEVTQTLRDLCKTLLTTFSDELVDGYKNAVGPDTFRLTDRLTKLSGVCQKKGGGKKKRLKSKKKAGKRKNKSDL